LGWRLERSKNPPSAGFLFNRDKALKQTLYKYCSISTENQLHRFIEILKGRIYFSSPSKFNDPFELSAKVNISTSPLLYGLTAREKEEVQRIFRLRAPEAVSEEWREKIGILCLSEDPKNILMWSHYANNHSGICIGFNTEITPFNTAAAITYSDERPKAEFNSNPNRLIERVLLTKSKHWQYEKEWRAIKRTIEDDELNFYNETFKADASRLEEIAETIEQYGGPNTYNFDTSAIRSIFFGARITKENKEILTQTIRTTCPHAKILQIELDNNYFWLNQKQLK
jgi:hypothetical protein